jgi:hypothetical protein
LNRAGLILRSRGTCRKGADAAAEDEEQKQKPIAPFPCRGPRLKRTPTQTQETKCRSLAGVCAAWGFRHRDIRMRVLQLA